MDLNLNSADTVSALIFDPEQSEMLCIQQSRDSLHDSDTWSCFEGSIQRGEHPIPALRRAMLEKLGLTLTENQYYYLQTLVTEDRRELTQYLVLLRKESMPIAQRKMVHMEWLSLETAASLQPLTSAMQRALGQFKSRFGSDADRANLRHMLKLATRSV